MRWREGRRSQNVEDRRGMRLGRAPVALGGGGLLILLVALFLGADPSDLLRLLGEGLPESASVGTSPGSMPAPSGAPADEGADFVSAVLADTEDTWSALFAGRGARYDAPRLVLFSDATRSGCGIGSAAVGPFYCPADATIYIDLAFYRDLRERFGAPGDFAQAYVIAHEVGHHVQQLLGIAERVEQARAGSSETEANALSVRLELQADCLAGVWGHHADAQRGILEAGDIEEALGAAAAIGDDRLQRASGTAVSPETWTHGSSEQRARWFRQGLASGDFGACDTFAAGRP